MIRLLLSFAIAPAMFAAATCVGVPQNQTGTLSQAVGAANLTGCLTATTGLTPDVLLGDWANASIAWQITQVGSGYFYEYKFDNGNRKNISHAIFGISASCTSIGASSTSGACIWGASTSNVNGSPEIQDYTSTSNGNSNPGLNGTLHGIKFNSANDPNPWDVSFYSNRVPVWQNFYAKSGNGTYANNNAVSGYFIAAPDTQTVVPEPGFYGILSLGLFGLGAAYCRRKRIPSA